MCAAVAICKLDEGSPEQIPKELLEFADIFSNKKAGTLPILKEGDHAIKIEEGKEPPYGPLYNLSQTELAELRRYLKDALIKG